MGWLTVLQFVCDITTGLPRRGEHLSQPADNIVVSEGTYRLLLEVDFIEFVGENRLQGDDNVYVSEGAYRFQPDACIVVPGGALWHLGRASAPLVTPGRCAPHPGSPCARCYRDASLLPLTVPGRSVSHPGLFKQRRYSTLCGQWTVRHPTTRWEDLRRSRFAHRARCAVRPLLC